MKVPAVLRRETFWALLIGAGVLLGVSLGSGAVSAGYQLAEDYELFDIQKDLESGKGFWKSVAAYTLGDHHRIRIYYLTRIAQVHLFGNRLWAMRAMFVVTGVVCLWGLTVFLRSLGLKAWEALGLGLFALLGQRTMIWWRMGTAENLGMFFLSVALLAMVAESRRPDSRRLCQSIFVVAGILMASAKESFIVSLPALVFLKIWHAHRTGSLSLKEALLRNRLPAACLIGVMGVQLLIILRVTGSVVGGYAGFEGVFWGKLWEAAYAFVDRNLFYIPVFAAWIFFKMAWQKDRDLKTEAIGFTGILGFGLLLILPLALLFQKTGISFNYVLPGLLATVFALGFLLRLARRKNRWAYAFLLVLIGWYLKNGMIGAWKTGRGFHHDGEQAGKVVEAVKKATPGNDAILFVLDLARNMEDSRAMLTYLKELGKRENIYLFPILRANYSEFEKYLIQDHPDKVLRYYRGRMFQDVQDIKSLKAIVVFPYAEFLFLLESKDWFKRGAFERENLDRFVVYTPKGAL